jgi:hypothetical protein
MKLGILVLIMAFAAATSASAEKVDWSDYIEKPSDRKPVPKQQTPAVAKTTPKKAAAKPAARARPKAKATAKPRAKAVARRKR